MKETKFKNTEIGPIPVDWEVKTLGEIGEPKMCKRILKDQTSLQGDIPFYKIGTFGGQADAFISQSLYDLMKSSYSFPKIGDILISAAGTIGRLVIYNGEFAYYQDSNIVWLEHDEKQVINHYLYHALKVINWKSEAGCSISRLYNSNLKSSMIAVPPLAEQEAIGEALREVDELIEGLKKLVAKKRDIKQGAMSQLLSGKSRLPGFSEPWNEVTLGEIGDFYKGKGIARAEAMSGTIPAIRYGEIYTHHHDYIRKFNSFISNDVANNSFRLHQGDICFAGSGETLEEIGKAVAYIHESDAYAGGDIVILRPKKNICSLFLGFAVNMPEVAKQKTNKGSGVSIMHITAKGLADIFVNIPTSLAEQKAIAKVLTDMDAEIEALSRKVAKYEQVKQGMMQQLLTGKIRLV